MILWIIFIAAEVARNWYMIERQKSKPNYFQSFTIRAMAAIAHGAFMDVQNWSEYLPILGFQVTTFWILFDIGLNLSRNKHPLYYNRSGWIEKIIGKYEMVYYCLKLAALLYVVWVIM